MVNGAMIEDWFKTFKKRYEQGIRHTVRVCHGILDIVPCWIVQAIFKMAAFSRNSNYWVSAFDVTIMEFLPTARVGITKMYLAKVPLLILVHFFLSKWLLFLRCAVTMGLCL